MAPFEIRILFMSNPRAKKKKEEVEEMGPFYRFSVTEPVFFKGVLLRKKTSSRPAGYVDVMVPVAPNHHFIPVGQVEYQPEGRPIFTGIAELKKLHGEMLEKEEELMSKDERAGKEFFPASFDLLVEKGVSTVDEARKVLGLGAKKETPKQNSLDIK
jgi:hypothetical protein